MTWEPRYPQETEGALFRTSSSTIETYARCGLRHEMDQAIKHRRTNVAMAIGTAAHEGARKDNQHKKDHGRGLAAPDIVDAAVAEYEIETAEAEVLQSRLEIATGKDDTADAAYAYARQISPHVEQVLFAEFPVIARLGDVELAGTPDYILRDLGVGDLKTGQPWTQDRTDRSRSLSAYGLLHHAQTGLYPRRVWIDSLYRSRRGWAWTRLWSYRTEAHYSDFWFVLNAARRGIEAGVFMAAPEGAWWCSAKWCPHWLACPAVAGRRTT